MPLSEASLKQSLSRCPPAALAQGRALLEQERVLSLRRLIGQIQGDVGLDSGGSARVTLRPGGQGPVAACTCPDGRAPQADGNRWCPHIAAVLEAAAQGHSIVPAAQRGRRSGLTTRALNRASLTPRAGPARAIHKTPTSGRPAPRRGDTPEAQLAKTVRRFAPLEQWLRATEVVKAGAVRSWRWRGQTLGGEVAERGREAVSAWVVMRGDIPRPGCTCRSGALGAWCEHSIAVARAAAMAAAGEATPSAPLTSPAVPKPELGRAGALRFLLRRRGRDLVVAVQESGGAEVEDLGGLMEAARLTAAGRTDAMARYRRSGSHGQTSFQTADLAVLLLLARHGRGGGAHITIDPDRAAELLRALISTKDTRGLSGKRLEETPRAPVLQLCLEPAASRRVMLRTLWIMPGLKVDAAEVPVLAFRGKRGGCLLAGDLVGRVADGAVLLSGEIPPSGQLFPEEEIVRRLEGRHGRPLPPGVVLKTRKQGPHRVGAGQAPIPVLHLSPHGDQLLAKLHFDYGEARVLPAIEALEFAGRYVARAGQAPQPSPAERENFLVTSPSRFAGLTRPDHMLWIPRDPAAELDTLLALMSAGMVLGPGSSVLCNESTAVEMAQAHGQVWRGCRIEGGELLKAFELAEEPLALELRVCADAPGGRSAGGGTGEGGWFAVELTAVAGEEKVDPALLLQLLASGKEYVPLARGQRARIPAETLTNFHSLLDTAGAVAQEGERQILFRARKASLGLFHEAASVAVEDADLRELAAGLAGSGTGLGAEGGAAVSLPDTPPPARLMAELRDYQLAGFRWLVFLARHRLGGVLADDMGLGKTVQTLALLQHLREVHGPAPSLVIAPSSVVLGWAGEAARFTPELRVLVLVGPRRWADDPRLAEYDLVLTSYALLRRDTARLATVAWRAVIFDEAQFLKNLATRSATAARLLRADARFALSGTPVENRLRELYALYDLVQPGLLGSEGAFDATFEQPIAAGGEAGARATAMLHRRIRPFLVRRLKAEVVRELPPRTEVELPVALLPGQARLYTDVLQTIRGELLGRVDREGMGKSTIHVLAALTRLRQIACDPRLLGKEVPPALRGSAKLAVLKGMLPELVSEGHAALLFSQFTGFLDHVESMLRELGLEWLRLDGSTPTAKRANLVQRFQEADGPPLFLISLKAGGTGLNLTRADYVFHLDPWWNPAVEDQATDRAHRIGQSRPVVAYRLLASGTVESRIRLLQERKRHLAAAVLGGDTGLAAKLGRDDLELLLGD